MKIPEHIRFGAFRWPLSCPLAIAALLLAAFCCSSFAQSVQLLNYNTVWKYDQSNTDLGTAWREPAYNDSAWPTGVAPLGFPANEGLLEGLTMQTILSRTVNGTQPRTYYFRTTFVFTNDPSNVSLVFSNLIDDAAVFFLNGVEVGRPGFNPGTVVTFSTQGDRAASDVTSYGFDVFTNLATSLVQGTNVVAVEVHQTGNNSSDLAFVSRVHAIIPTPVSITRQPTNSTFFEGHTAVLSAQVAGTSPALQWYKEDVAVMDATNSSLTISNVQMTHAGSYYLVASNFFNVVTSDVVTLTVVVDDVPPTLVSVRADDTFRRIHVQWSEVVLQDTAVDPANYYLFDPSNTQVPIGSVEYFGSRVVLHLAPPAVLEAAADYEIEFTFQQDPAGNLTDPMGNPQQDPGNGVLTNFQSWAISPGFTRFDAYLNLLITDASTVAQLVADPDYPNNPNFGFYTNVIFWPQSVPNIERYGMRFTGLFIAPETGDFMFDPDHDDPVRLRFSADDNPNNPTFFEYTAGCCTGFSATDPGLTVSMVAGQRYYFEVLVMENGGGDHAGLAVKLPSGGYFAPVPARYLATPVSPETTAANNANIAQQPQSQTIEENHAVTFSVVVTNISQGGAAYQWQVDSGSGFTDIAGATAATYTTPYLTLANNGNQYRVRVQLLGKTLLSDAATVTVITDTTDPLVTSARGSRFLNAIRVVFNEPVLAATAEEISNYELRDTNGTMLTITSPVLSADLTTVTISTDAQTPGAVFTVTVRDIQDIAGNLLAETNLTFQTWTYSRGFLLFETFDTASTPGNAVTLLTGHPNYPNNPRQTFHIPTFDSRNAYPTDVNEQYGGRISGLFLAPATTNHIFYLRSDDASELHLSTDSNPANAVKIAEETGCCRAFSAISSTNALTAGQAYYIQLLYKEGTGGDFGQSTFKFQGDPTNPDNLAPASGTHFWALADPIGASVTITQHPASVTIAAGTNTTLTVRAHGTIATGPAPFSYQWQRLVNGVWTDINGAYSTNYNTGPLNSVQSYRVLVFVPGASAVSDVATVTAGAPRLRIQRNGNSVTVAWSASFTGYTLESSSAVAGPTWTAEGPVVTANGENTVTLNIVPGESRYFRLRQ